MSERQGPRTVGSIFTTLRAGCAETWNGYVRHPFVVALAAGTLPEPCFRHYLIQDYLFLVQFARAYGLAAYKATHPQSLIEQIHVFPLGGINPSAEWMNKHGSIRKLAAVA